jgi:hypothetical protein
MESWHSQNELHLPQFFTVVAGHLERPFRDLGQNFVFDFTVVFDIFNPKGIN